MLLINLKEMVSTDNILEADFYDWTIEEIKRKLDALRLGARSLRQLLNYNGAKRSDELSDLSSASSTVSVLPQYHWQPRSRTLHAHD